MDLHSANDVGVNTIRVTGWLIERTMLLTTTSRKPVFWIRTGTLAHLVAQLLDNSASREGGIRPANIGLQFLKYQQDDGEGGIRTHVPVTRQHAFEARPLDHFGTSPLRESH